MKKYGLAGIGMGALAFVVLAGCQQDPSSPADKTDAKARIKQQHETCAEVLHLSLDKMECPQVGVAKAAIPRPEEAVCGVDGRTYADYCGATGAGVEVAYDGDCIAKPDTCGRGLIPIDPTKDCVCTMEYDPVCGVNGATYGNACAASCGGVEVAHKGECEGPRIIPIGPIEPIDPIVIVDPIPGDSACKPGKPIITPVDPIDPINPGDPDPGMGCIALWDPVCGVNGATYGNECEALIRKVEVAHKGACESVRKP